MLRTIAIASFLAWSTVFAQEADYGVDCSFPIHGKDLKCGNLLGDRKKVYEEFMDGCRESYGKKGDRCDSTENDRIEMSQRQPQSLLNYTSTGFMKVKAPKEVMDLLSDHWQKNKHIQKKEAWPPGNIYVNHWASPTYMVSVEDTSLENAGHKLKSAVWNAAKSTIEEWTGMEQNPTSMYGIRVYTEGAILSPHVDRLPLIGSCIINVDQDVDEPWVLEVYDHHDRAVNVTMEPGDMVLYESGSLVHGRPFAMKGRFYANIFIHFEPTGRPLDDTTGAYLDTLDDFLPPYLLPDSPEVENYKQRNPQGWRKPSPSAPIQQFASPETEGHTAAATGDIARVTKLTKRNRKLLHKKDANGWQPLHEAVRGGHKDVAEFLIKNGAEKNARVGPNGTGSSPLNLALTHHTASHPVTRYLLSIGAKNIADDGEL